MIRAIFLSLIVAGVSAFAPPQMLGRRSQWMVQNAQMLSDIDEMCLENTASLCTEEEDFCDLEEEQALMNTLESQAHSVEILLEEMQSLAFALSFENTPQLSHLESHQVAGHVMSQMDTMGLMNTATYCAEEGCYLEDNEALVNRLHEQSEMWSVRLMEILSVLKQTQTHLSIDSPEISSLKDDVQGAMARDYEMNENTHSVGA
jgi:hypothetical protein